MPSPRLFRLDPDKRAAIFSAAAEEFATHGFEGASYNRIIERAGVSKGAMYYYFDDKADLFTTVVTDVFEQLEKDLPPPPPEVSAAAFWRSVHGHIDCIIRYGRENPTYVALMRATHEFEYSGVTDVAVKEVCKKSRERIERFLRDGQQVGAVRGDLPLSLLVELVFVLDRTVGHWIAERVDELTSEDLSRAGRMLCDQIKRVLRPADSHHGRDGRSVKSTP